MMYGSSIDPVAAFSYVREIKDTFVDQVEKIDLVGVIERVRELFEGHPSFLLGFNAYVPNGYKIMLSDEDKASSKKTTNNEEEHNLVKNIKVVVLFNDHPDMLDDFIEFLKDSVTPNPLSSLCLVLNLLLPFGYDIILNDEGKPPLKKSIHFERIFNFVNKIRKERKDINEVAVIHNDLSDLLDEFSGFLQDLVTTNLLCNSDGDKN
ncbi:hypothetical protein RDI58_024379 [Solanum bulbocastanum]|uniref:Uncharacterized protein n=1 Tax=Solanum bulbocastanum TaxID=147425 RepID=A0AAN8T375_SOLBU